MSALRISRSRQRLLAASFAPALALVGSLALVAGLLLALGADPLTAFAALTEGAFGSQFAVGDMIAKTTPLLLAGIGVAWALSARLFNIGAEGQIYIGGLAGAWFALTVPAPGPVVVVGALLFAGLGGALWAGVAGLLRAKRGVNEVITTLLLNYVAIQLVNYLVSGPFQAPGATFPKSRDLAMDARLPDLIPRTQGHIGIVIAVLGALALAWMLRRTTFGFRVRTLGGGERTTSYAGLSVGGVTVAALGLSGAMAGLAGGIEVLGVQGNLVQGFSPGYGFDALAVALLARGNLLLVIPAAALFGALRAGSNNLQAVTGVPADAVLAIQAIVVLCVIAAYAFDERRRWSRARREARERASAAPSEVVPDAAVGLGSNDTPKAVV